MSEQNTGTDLNTNQPDHGHPNEVFTWTPQKAAQECQVGRSTIMRKLYAGEIPGAKKIEGTWQIPVPELIAAGFHPGRPTPIQDHDTPGKDSDQSSDQRTVQTGSQVSEAQFYAQAQEIIRLQAEVEISKARLEAETAKRTAAEQIAEERRARITDLQQALRMLTPGNNQAARGEEPTATHSPTEAENEPAPSSPAPPVVPAARPTSATSAEASSVGFLARVRRWLG